jgi:hypothetical protein
MIEEVQLVNKLHADFIKTRPNPPAHLGIFIDTEVKSTLMNLAMKAILDSPALFKSTDDKDSFTVPIDITDSQGQSIATTTVIVTDRDVLNAKTRE